MSAVIKKANITGTVEAAAGTLRRTAGSSGDACAADRATQRTRTAVGAAAIALACTAMCTTDGGPNATEPIPLPIVSDPCG